MSQQTSALRVPRFAEQAYERAVESTRLRVVPAVRTRAPRAPFAVLVAGLLLGGVIGLLMFNTSLQSSAFAADALEDKAATLSAREEALSTDLETLRDPETIARKAQRLGMQIPAAPLFLSLSDGTVSGDVAGASVGASLNLREKATRVPSSWQAAPATTSSGSTDEKADEKSEKKSEKKQKAEKKNEKAEKKQRTRASAGESSLPTDDSAATATD
ncbi:hypothetical protein [Nocardioides bruguierae]|uniref:hypothetical protein n=1 Tax=Nocardioides bruguierae TaxID=2945102 RepID=UPI002020D6F3|nr:hypothetical protein [Nocardioides bruguierae]MCL8026995.1 hypothetical protein [Nocardioides bruguierae]